MSTTGRIARGVLAGAALAVVLAGVPILLVTAVGWPLPHAIPAWSDLTSTLSGTTPLDNHVVWKVLAVVIWIAWAQLAVGAALELDSARRGVLAPAVRGFGLGQGTAGYLIGLITLALPPGAATTIPAPSVRDVHLLAAPAAHTAPIPAASPANDPTPAATVGTVDHVVQPRENLWVIARRYLPPDATHAEVAAKVRRIFDDNTGHPQPDGRALTNGSEIQPGWTLRIETGAAPTSAATESHRQVTVAPGDTLSGIAKTQLGAAEDYHQLFDTNRGRPQPDGGALVDENLIRPGWILELPPPTPAETPPTTGAVRSAIAPEVVPTPAPPTTVPAEPTTSPPSTVGVLHDSTPGRAIIATPSPPKRADGDREHRVPLPVGLLAGGLSTAGVVALLDRRRRARLRHRQPAQHIALPSTALQRAERNLRAGAATDQALLLDAAVRAVAGAGDVPTLRWVEAGSDHVVLQLAAPAAAPAGFTSVSPDRWQTAVSVDELAQLGATAVPPTPALAPLGVTPDGVEVLIDLETNPVTTISGPRELVIAQLRGMTVSLATAVWSEDAVITLVGRDQDLPDLPGTRWATSLSHAIDQLVIRAEEAATALASVNATSTLEARVAGSTPDAWAPLIAVSTDPPTDLDGACVDALVMCDQRAVALLCAADDGDGAAATITLDESGNLRLRDCPLTIAARRLETGDEEVIIELLEAAASSEDVGPSELIEPIAARTASTTDRPIETGVPSTLADLVGELDVLVRVMGEVEAVRLDAGGETQLAASKQKGLEAIAYLATRDSGVPLEDVQAALWPSGANSMKTFRNAISSARSALGADRDGLPLLPNPEASRYDLSNRVATDYELFHELTRYADLLGDDQVELAIRLLTDALSLVRGEPYVGIGRNYAWVAQHRGIIVTQVVNAAEELADIHLALGDWRAAEWAARQGLRAFPCDERLYRVLMRVAHAAGSLAGVQRAFHELCQVVADPDIGAEPEDTVHPETLALLEELTAAPPADRVSA